MASEFATTLAAGDQTVAQAIDAVDAVSTTGDVCDPAALLRAVAVLHSTGAGRAAQALRLYAEEADRGAVHDGALVDGLRVILVVRLLYPPVPGREPQAAPALGKPDVSLAPEPRLCPYWPLIVCCDIPFLPVGGFALGGAPASATRFVEEAGRLGQFRDAPLEPTCSVADAAEELVASAAWQAAVPDEQAAYGRMLVYLQAVRAAGLADPTRDHLVAELAAAAASHLDETWQRVAAPVIREHRWDPVERRFVS